MKTFALIAALAISLVASTAQAGIVKREQFSFQLGLEQEWRAYPLDDISNVAPRTFGVLQPTFFFNRTWSVQGEIGKTVELNGDNHCKVWKGELGIYWKLPL